MARGDGAHVRLRDRVVAPEDHGDCAGRHGLADRVLDLRVRPLGIGGHDRRVAEVHDPELLERVDLRLEMRPGGQLAARIARGPKRVPGRSETRSSVGAPTTATSAPASAAGSCVYGIPAYVRRPA